MLITILMYWNHNFQVFSGNFEIGSKHSRCYTDEKFYNLVNQNQRYSQWFCFFQCGIVDLLADQLGYTNTARDGER